MIKLPLTVGQVLYSFDNGVIEPHTDDPSDEYKLEACLSREVAISETQTVGWSGDYRLQKSPYISDIKRDPQPQYFHTVKEAIENQLRKEKLYIECAEASIALLNKWLKEIS